MAKTRNEMIQAIESLIANLHTMEKELVRRAIEEGIPIWKKTTPDGSLVMERVCLAQAQAYLALVTLQHEAAEDEPEKELLFHEMQHIYWSANGTSFCLSPPGTHGFLGTRSSEKSRPDCPECHEKLEQLRSVV